MAIPSTTNDDGECKSNHDEVIQIRIHLLSKTPLVGLFLSQFRDVKLMVLATRRFLLGATGPLIRMAGVARN